MSQSRNTTVNFERILRNFGRFLKPVPVEWRLCGIAFGVILLLQVFVLYVFIKQERQRLGEKWENNVSHVVHDWNAYESMIPSGKVRSCGFRDYPKSIKLYVDKWYTIKLDEESDFIRVHQRVSADLNPENPINIFILDSLLHEKHDSATVPRLAFRHLDSLGRVLEVSPRLDTTAFEPVGMIPLGFLSGERIAMYLHYTWQDFWQAYPWRVWGVLLGGCVLWGMVLVFTWQIRKQRRLRQVQESTFRQRMHDLKNPVVAVESLLEMVHEEHPEAFRLEGDETDYYGEGKASLLALQRDVTNVLDVAEMLYRKRLTFVQVALREEIVRLVQELRWANREQKQIELELVYTVPEELRLSSLFVFVLQNLLVNAVRYSGEQVQIRVVVCWEGKHLRVEVSDRGNGIAQADLPYIFDEFWKVGNKGENHGIGLTFVKKVVKRHGGRIRVESVLGKGTCFKMVFYGFRRKS